MRPALQTGVPPFTRRRNDAAIDSLSGTAVSHQRSVALRCFHV
jgi:hypothetical protein